LLVLALFHLQVPFFDHLEHMIYDVRAHFRLKPKAAQKDNEIVIVTIDEDSVNKIGRWPWPRSTMAMLLKKLAEYQPKVVGLNILFSEPEDTESLQALKQLEGDYWTFLLSKKKRTPQEEKFLLSISGTIQKVDNDSKLANILSDTHNTVLAMSFDLTDIPPAAEESIDDLPYALSISSLTGVQNPEGEMKFKPEQAAGIVFPLDEFAEGSLGAGHVSILPDTDGVIRRDLPFVKFIGKYYPSFPLQIARIYQGLSLNDIHIFLGKEILLGSIKIPLDKENRMSISYVGKPGTFPSYSFFDIINDKVQPSVFKNKIVLVGFTASGLGSLYVTPVAHNFPGVETIANVIQNILHKNFIVIPPWSFKAELGSILLVGLFVTLLLPRFKAGAGFLSSLLLGAAIVLPANYLFAKEGYWIKLVYPFFFLVTGYILVISKKFFTTEKKRELVEASEIETNKMLGLSFQGQGQLDLAFEKFRRCPVNEDMKDVLYNLGLDFERKRQFSKAVSVYEIISKTDSNFKDITAKIDLLKKAAAGVVFGSTLSGRKGGTTEGSLLIDFGAIKPTLGRYEILKELGRGAMGVVYLGRDPKINRTVAIKTMMFEDNIEEADLKELKERFFREAESAGSLSHPNIVKIFDAGEDQEMAFIAMELMEGEDLKTYSTKDKLLPIPKVIEYVATVADALNFAHQQGIFHRDIKPANIMLLKDGTIRVADFGIARIQGSSATVTGTVLGTPSYMSPEQLEGKKIDGKSDLFSLGVSLYELLTGEKPFKGGDAIATLLFQIANDPTPNPQTVRPEISDALVQVIDRALEKDQEKRYQRGEEMAADLRNCLNGS